VLAFDTTDTRKLKLDALLVMFYQRGLLFILCGAYFAALRQSYELVESHLFQSIGLVYAPPSVFFEWLSAVMAVVPALWLPIRLKYASQVCYWILYLTVVAPMMFLPYHVLPLPASEVTILPAYILLLFAVLYVCYRFPTPRIRGKGDPALTSWLLVATVAVLTCLAFVASGGFRLNLALDDVYDRRLSARDVLLSGSLVAYAVSTLSYSAAPIILLLGYVRRNFAMVGLGVIGLLAVYSLRATKTDLFMPIYLVALCALVQHWRRFFGPVLLAGAIMTIGLSIGQFLVFQRYDISDYLIRRQFFVPSMLTSWYWEYFSSHPLIYFTDRSYGQLWNTPRYHLPMARLIGFEYFNNSDINANTCFWASAYANVGYAGMAVATLLLGCILRLFDALAEHSEFIVVAGMAGLLGFQLANGALETCMLTGGVLVSMIVFYYLPERRAGRSLPPLAARPVSPLLRH